MSPQSAADVSLETLDKERVLHPATSIADHLKSGPRIITDGAGVTLTDSAGRRYIDAVAGLWCVNIGYGRHEVADAMAAQSRRLAFYHTFSSMSNEPHVRLADRLLGLTPGKMSKVFFSNSGSEANDTQVKLVWYYNNLRGQPKKKKIIARLQGYHGSTVASASLTGLPVFHAAFDLPIAGILHVKPPYHYRDAAPGQSEEQYASALAADLEATIQREGPDTVAAFIAEPVMGAGGVLVPPRSYFPKIQEVLRRHDVLMIADEVICGFGRLGRLFGSEVFGIEPDLMTVAKGLTSGYFPVSACFVSEPIWAVLRDASPQTGAFAHGFTYSGHPVGAAAAMANLDILLGEDLVGNSARVGEYLQRQLRETVGSHPLVGEVRGVGLIAGVELVADQATKAAFAPELKVAYRVVQRCMAEGLIVRALPAGQVVAFSPPLCITRAEVDQVVERFARGLAAVADELSGEGHTRR
jgi:L-2,4-diaminobutyrate transaminase